MKKLFKFALWTVIALIAFFSLAWIVISLVDYKWAALAVVLTLGGLAFKYMSWGKATVYMLVFLLVNAILLPKWQQAALVPYIEMYRNNIRDQIKSAKERDGHFPQDISVLLDQTAHYVGGGAGSRYRILKSRPYTYDPATGEFSIELM